MRHRRLASMGALAVGCAVVMLARVPVAGQAPSSTTKAKTPTAAAKAYTPPRTVDGQPDLQGVWANNNATPLERPKIFNGRARLTPQEVAALKKRAAELFSGDGDAAFGDSIYEAVLSDVKQYKPTTFDKDTGNYNAFWIVERDFDDRTSLITDPADGRIPAMTDAAKKRQTESTESRKKREFDSYEFRPLSERCVTFGTPDLLAGYNSYYQIFQTKDYVVMTSERIHDSRIIWLDGRPHLPKNVRQILGDSRGHWEGNTLVADTTNFAPENNLRGSSENLHLTERFTRVGPTTINYEVTIEDPTVWTKPWTLMIPLKQSNEEIFEYACHEGNSSLHGVLAGARAKDKEAAGGGASKSSRQQ